MFDNDFNCCFSSSRLLQVRTRCSFSAAWNTRRLWVDKILPLPQVAQIAAKAKSGHYPVDGRLQAVFQAWSHLKPSEIDENSIKANRNRRESEVLVRGKLRRSGTATSRTESRRRNKSSALWWTGCATSTAPARGKAVSV